MEITMAQVERPRAYASLQMARQIARAEMAPLVASLRRVFAARAKAKKLAEAKSRET